jgi:RHS repeat-associated protein
LIVDGEQTYVKIDDKDGFISKVFDSKGLIKYIRSQFGGEIEVIRNAQGQATQLKDNYSGRYLEFTYDTYGRLVSVSAPESRNWTYTYNVNGLLSTATNPISGTWNYEYSENKLSKITNPRGNDTYFTYDTNNKVNNIQQEGSTNSTNIYYSASDYHSTKMVKPAGETYYEVFSQDSQLAAVIDGNGEYGIVDYHPLQMEKPATLFNQIGDFVAANLYNQNGDVLKQFDADGNYKEYTYTTNGKIASYKDRASKTTSITWNQDESMPIKITDALGRETTYEYDTNKNLIKIKTPFKDNNPAETTFEYDTNGYVKKITNALGKTTEYTYNNCGEVTSIKDAYGKITSYTLDKMGMVTKVTGPSPDNREGTNTYDACQNLVSTTNFRGYTTTYEYDQRENRIKATNALSQNTYYTYDDSGKLTKVKDHKNNETNLTYDNLGRILKVTDQEGKYTEALYDDLGRVSGYKNKLGDETSIEYNTLYRQSQATSAQGAETKYEYDKEGHITKVTDPLNRSTYFEYDACYQLTKVTDNAGKYSTVEYWPSGQIKKNTDPLNHIAEYDYNKLGLPVSVKDNEAYETTMLYDDLGRCTRVTNALNGYKSFEYNMYGLLTKSTNELGKFTTYEYDENGNQTKQTTSLGKEYRWTYDAIDRVKKTITPMGFEYEKTYDDVGNVIEIKDPLQHLESFEYTSTYNLNKYIDQINNQTSYNYNDANDLTKTTLPKGTFQEYTYDKDGNVKTVIDPLGNTATYNYNIGGELTERQLPKIGGGTTSFTYAYDTIGRRTTFTDEASKSTTCTYNDIGLVTQLSHPNGKTISSTYDTLNRLTGVTFGGGETFSYSYDSRPTQINLASGGQINNTFDNAARLTHSDLPNGVDLDFTYNNANNPTNKTYSLPDPFFNNGPKVQTFKPKDPDSLFVTIGKQAQSLYNKLGPNPTFGDICTLLLDQKFYGTLRTIPVIVASFSYTYDANKNISQRSYPNGIQNFTYDNYDRLTQAIASEGTYIYTYDVRNNRSTMRFFNYNQTVDQTTTYTYSIDDRLTSYTVVNNLNQQTIRTVNYTYDDAGNTLTKAVTEGGTTLTTTYTYYDDNRLKTTTLPSNEIITYTYHADGTRATKSNATEWIRYHYSGGLVKEVHCDKNNHSTILFTIHYQPGRIIYQPNQGDNVYYYTASDCSGTIYKLLNDQGQIVTSYNYDPFGVLIENTNPSIYMPIGYSGTYRDTETGLLYAQSRYYDPSIGRFTTKDSYRGELVSQISQNRYIYCSQNPVSYGDPSGFAPIEGDDTNEVSICTQKTKNEQTVKPLKQSKTAKDEEIKAGEGGASYDPKDGSFTINIGGHEIKMKYDPKTGKCDVYAKHLNDPEADAIANGIRDAMNALPKSAKDSIFSSLSSVSNYAKKLDTYYKNNFNDYCAMYGKDATVRHFFFSATVGYACAEYLINSNDPGDRALIGLMGGIQMFGNITGKDCKGGLFDLLMTMGFHTAHLNSNGNDKNGYKLNQVFSNLSKSNDLNSNASLVDQVRVLGILYCSSRILEFKAQGVSVENFVGSVLGFLFSLGLSGTGWVLAYGAVGLCISTYDIADTGRQMRSSKTFNDLGVTQKMIDACIKNGILSLPPNGSDLSVPTYSAKSMFGSIGLVASYYHACLHVAMGNLKSSDKKIKLGDLFFAADRYVDNYVNSYKSLSYARDKYRAIRDKSYFHDYSIDSVEWTDFTDERYLLKGNLQAP